MSRMRRALVVVSLGCVLSGCGGGSGGVGALTTTEGQIRKGWERTYSVSGFFTPNGGSQQLCHGTMVETCTDRTGTQVTTTRSLQLTVNGVTNTYLTTYVSNQAADGTITLVSETDGNNPTLTVQSTTFSIPGTWTTTTSVSGTTTFTDSSTSTESLVVSGNTQIASQVGSFNTWTTQYQHSYQGNQDINLTEYYVPSIAGYAYATGSLVLSDGTFSGTLDLQQTDIALP